MLISPLNYPSVFFLYVPPPPLCFNLHFLAGFQQSGHHSWHNIKTTLSNIHVQGRQTVADRWMVDVTVFLGSAEIQQQQKRTQMHFDQWRSNNGTKEFLAPGNMTFKGPSAMCSWKAKNRLTTAWPPNKCSLSSNPRIRVVFAVHSKVHLLPPPVHK